MPRDEFTADDAKRFYDGFGAKQDLQFYENPALERLIAHADFERAWSVFELGCGTGRLAERLFRERLPPTARYVGVDVSTTMTRLAEQRLTRWKDRSVIRQSDGTARQLDPDRSGLTEGQRPVSRAICAVWKALHALSPRLVGGCRPLRVREFLDGDLWRIDHAEVASAWGVCSEIIVAAKTSDV